jgi:hypothetical protein
MVRSSAHVTPFTQRKYKLTFEESLSRPDLHPLHHHIDLKVLGHAGHIQRMDERRLPRMLRDGDVEGKNAPGGQHKTHAKKVTQSLMRKGIIDGEWKEWKKGIIDEGFKKRQMACVHSGSKKSFGENHRHTHSNWRTMGNTFGHHCRQASPKTFCGR